MIFYSLTSILSIVLRWSESKLSYVIIAATVVYVIVFLVVICIRRNDTSKMRSDMSDYKRGMKLWKTILNLVSTAIALLVMISTLQADDVWSKLDTAIFAALSIAWLVFKVLTTSIKLIRWFKKDKKIRNKRAEQLSKQ